jgi:hypothetical protein
LSWKNAQAHPRARRQQPKFKTTFKTLTLTKMKQIPKTILDVGNNVRK